ncbi:hypothetical protein FQZ97_721070 [compost metagenome]
MAVRAQPARRLGQHCEQRRFGAGQLGRRLAQVGPTGRRHPLQGAAEGRTVEVETEDVVLRQVPFQLRGAPELAQLAAEGARVRVEQPRHLHRQGTAAGNHAPAPEVEPGSAGQGQRVHPGVLVEPAVLVGEQGFQVIRRNLVPADRVTPHAFGIGEAPERRAILRQHHPRQIIARQGQREQTVGGPEQRQEQHREEDRGPAQTAPNAIRPRLRHPGGLWFVVGLPGHVVSRARQNQAPDGPLIRLRRQGAGLLKPEHSKNERHNFGHPLPFVEILTASTDRLYPWLYRVPAHS